ncbi:hypothetical protein DRF62_03180 [Chryseobacterium piscium]|uniref:Uncharacterized protein n=1 Tax=Chryseobacterium piscium TaxID=333702 RepID=A0A3D9BT89_9FLAO|nr:hypothetical protein [Chryseobacterium piscium]REC56571.1 hypothetical protein DRF62_03180 [Chryseobacterium piscium]
MMNSIDLQKLRNAEYLQYMKDFSGIINLNKSAQFDIEAKLNAFNTKIGELETLYKKALASEKNSGASAHRRQERCCYQRDLLFSALSYLSFRNCKATKCTGAAR